MVSSDQSPTPVTPLEQYDLELPGSHSEQLSPGIAIVDPGHLNHEKIRETVEEELTLAILLVQTSININDQLRLLEDS